VPAAGAAAGRRRRRYVSVKDGRAWALLCRFGGTWLYFHVCHATMLGPLSFRRLGRNCFTLWLAAWSIENTAMQQLYSD